MYRVLSHMLLSRGMASVFSDKAIRGPEASRLGHMAEGFLEVISRLVFRQPQALQSLLGGDPDAEARFIDNWLAIAGTRYLPWAILQLQ